MSNGFRQIDYSNPYYKCTSEYIMQKYWERKTKPWADKREADIKRAQEILDGMEVFGLTNNNKANTIA